MPTRPSEQQIDRPEIKEAQLFGALDSPAEPIRREHCRQIEQGARERSDGNAVENSPILGQEASMVAMQWWLGPAAGGRRYVNHTRTLPEQLPEPGSRNMAEEGVWRASQDRPQIATLRGEVRVAYGIDAAMESMQAAQDTARVTALAE